jgi:phosphoribosyl-AMP cyclohydrolase
MQGIDAIKLKLQEMGLTVKALNPAYQWADFKQNSDGMVPVVVQDDDNEQVLMVAYMNEEAYNTTVATGIMTYYSRSRQELWIKGLTSGHFQYVKSLYIDCDNDTILARVKPVGPACHTGNQTCFYRNIEN